MRYLLSIVFLFVLASAGISQVKKDTLKQVLSAADSTAILENAGQADSINIKEMVAEQINAIKEKELERPQKVMEIARTEPEIKPSPPTKAALSDKWNSLLNVSVSPLFDKIYNFFSSADDVTIKISILGLASFIALFVVMLRRKIIKRKYLKKDSLKDNIRLLREEKVIKRSDSKLTGIRNSLVNNPLSYKKTQSGISKVAKELNIAKGELLLAAKIKSHELNKSWQGSIHKNMNWRIF